MGLLKNSGLIILFASTFCSLVQCSYEFTENTTTFFSNSTSISLIDIQPAVIFYVISSENQTLQILDK